MKKLILTVTLVIATIAVNAQIGKQIGKVIGAKKGGKETPAAKAPENVQMKEKEGEFTDEFGFSGRYYMLDTTWSRDIHGNKTKTDGSYQYSATQKWKFTREENGNIVNNLLRYEGEGRLSLNDSYRNNAVLEEKLKEKYNVNVFLKSYSATTYLLVELEKDVWAEAEVDYYKLVVKKYINTYAKDQAKLEVYDMETSAAIMQKKLNEIKLKQADAERAKWMKNETFAKMVGKIGFIDQYTKVGYNSADITEKPDVFTSSIELGKQSLFYRAYFQTPGELLCNGCELNTTYEINGIKLSRVDQRKQSAKWSRVIKQKFVDNRYFTGAPPIVSFSENIADYAFLYCLYLNKDKIKDGTTLKMKVTLTSSQEGVDKDVLAEGTISLVYKEANKAGFDKMMKWIEDFLEE